MARAQHHLSFADLTAQEHPEFVDWAAVGLFYSALHWAHAALDGEHDLPKDERHPRKHSAPRKAMVGGRGVTQLVRDLYGPVYFEYRSLFEASVRTRYDFSRLDPDPFAKLRAQHQVIERHLRTQLERRGVVDL